MAGTSPAMTARGPLWAPRCEFLAAKVTLSQFRICSPSLSPKKYLGRNRDCRGNESCTIAVSGKLGSVIVIASWRWPFMSETTGMLMSQPEPIDVLILGSGGGGKLTAWHNGRSGRRVAVVERRWVGGSCPNIACLPSKNEIRSAEVAHLARRGAEFGAITGPVKVDMAKVVSRKRAMVQALVDTHLKNYRESGAELIMGSGRFVAPKTLEVTLNDGGTRTLVGDKVFLNVGTHAAIPDVPGLDAARPMTHIEALDLDILPGHLIVIGGGYAGLELAQAYRRFGAEVTVVEAGSHLMAREDVDASHEIKRILTDEGLQIHVPAELVKVSGQSGNAVSVVVRTSAGEQAIEGSHILVAAGRIPNTAGIGLDQAGVELTERGFVRVNERLETSAPDVWALGECAGSRCSRIYPKTTFESFATIWPGGSAARATGSFPIACSPTRRSRMSA